MEKLKTPSYWKFCVFLISNWARRRGYYIQQNKETGLLHTDKQSGRVCGTQLDKKTGSTNLGRCNVCRGRSLQVVNIQEKTTVDRHLLHALSVFELRPLEGFVSLTGPRHYSSDRDHAHIKQYTCSQDLTHHLQSCNEWFRSPGYIQAKATGSLFMKDLERKWKSNSGPEGRSKVPKK